MAKKNTQPEVKDEPQERLVEDFIIPSLGKVVRANDAADAVKKAGENK